MVTATINRTLSCERSHPARVGGSQQMKGWCIDMMIGEFIQLTGFEPTQEEYREIEAEYMGCDIDKTKFCKDWKRNGGIQRLSRIRARRIEELEAQLATLQSQSDKRETELCEALNMAKREREEARMQLDVLKNNIKNLL